MKIKYRLKQTFGRRISPIKYRLPHDISIKGSYYTGNIGDRAIGSTIKTELERKGFSTYLFDKTAKRGNSQLTILGGGGVLHDWQGIDTLEKRLQSITYGDIIMGVGVPGILSEQAKKLIKRKVQNANLITVRDARSKQNLETVTDREVVLTACPAFLQSDPGIETSYATGVNFRPWFNMDKQLLVDYFGYSDDIVPENAKRKYIKNCKQIVSELNNPIFIPFHKKDEEFARKHLDIDIHDYVFSVTETLKRVSKIEKMVCTRYHSLIFSLVCDKPVLPIAYAPKVSSLADRIGIPSYKPHKEMAIEFNSANDIEKIEQSARLNFDLFMKNGGSREVLERKQ